MRNFNPRQEEPRRGFVVFGQSEAGQTQFVQANLIWKKSSGYFDMRVLFSKIFFICLAVWFGCALPAASDTPVTYTDRGQKLFRFVVPDFWALRVGGPRSIEDTNVGDPRAVARVMGMRPVTDDAVWMGFVSPEGVETIEDGVQYLQDIDKFLVKDAKLTESVRQSIGGLPAHVFRGTGRRDGRGVNFTATVIDLPRGRVAVAVAVLQDGADPAYVEDLNAIFDSFRAMQ
ncbi:hypothetical protein [Ruegeria arenilitoris]|uniref:hypothetical protein n=1 Tax=Ruegeria arenilitoris TaxID=1173585 RepID=UPI0020C5ADC6|nr:hypothetical protein [Ruegeria arenilitoris]